MIHTYTLNNYHIVVDAASGAVHSVDEGAFDMICLIDDRMREGADFFRMTKSVLSLHQI